ncbi:MAG: glycosyltransferase family 4 protein, partial [Planctomycetota bacterium]
DITDVISLTGLRESVPDLSYLSYVHILRSVVAQITTRLLLIAHRSQTVYLFDLIQRHPTVIYCDGYFDGHFRMSMDLGFPQDDEQRLRTLSEIYYLLGNTDPNFLGIGSMPVANRFLLMAGCQALMDARENWCWGERQRELFDTAFPALEPPASFQPPFMDSNLFDPSLEDRQPFVLFTTTMHNIELKGFPELVLAMEEISDLRVRCIVRQPQHLPEYPEELEPRFEMGGVPKSEMVGVYHRAWLNCRVSREESSPVSILESMICAVPQVTSPVVAEQIPILEDGETGFIVDPDDTPGLVRALEALMGDRGLRDRMGQEARRRALTYTFEERVERFDAYLSQ